MAKASRIIDDLSGPAPHASGGAAWEMIADTVMGGQSNGCMTREAVAGRPAIRLRGAVSLENNGGFLQLALNLDAGGRAVDASDWRGIELDVSGNGEQYNMHLRTDDVIRPWQSYRQSFIAELDWTTIKLPFEMFEAHRIDTPLALTNLRRIGLVGIGRAFAMDLAIARICFYS